MIEKHSLILNEHHTSVSLEPEFWKLFQALARMRGKTVNQLASEIDRNRDIDTNMASAMRLFVLHNLTALGEAERDAILGADG